MANGEVLRSTFMLEIELNVNGEHSGPLFVQKCSLPQGWEKILLGAPGCFFGKVCLLPQARLQTATSFYQIENRVLQRTSRLTNSKQFKFSFQSCFSPYLTGCPVQIWSECEYQGLLLDSTATPAWFSNCSRYVLLFSCFLDQSEKM